MIPQAYPLWIQEVHPETGAAGETVLVIGWVRDPDDDPSELAAYLPVVADTIADGVNFLNVLAGWRLVSPGSVPG